MAEKLIIQKKRPRGADGYKVFSIRIREETLDAISDLAEETGRTRNELIGMLLDFGLMHAEAGK